MNKNIKNLILSLIVGLVIGIITLLLQGILPINLNFLANSGAVWSVPAFLLTFHFNMDKKFSIINCMICLLGCVFGYYVFEAIKNGHSFIFEGYIVFWTGVAFVSGAIFGLGANFANTKNNWLKYCGINLLPAVFISEGLSHLIHIDSYKHMVGAIVLKILIGLILYFMMNKNASFKKENILFTLLIIALGTIGFEIILHLT